MAGAPKPPNIFSPLHIENQFSFGLKVFPLHPLEVNSYAASVALKSTSSTILAPFLKKKKFKNKKVFFFSFFN